MRIVFFGLSISSAWGNGHATLLRSLFRALHQQGHEIKFFERDVSYYAAHRDASQFDYVDLCLYQEWNEVLPFARKAIAEAEAAVVTSYCADGIAACDLVLNSTVQRKVFYDMDTPVTLARLARGETVPYVPKEGLSGFDLVLSYTGGDALDQLQKKLGAMLVAPLYGWVDTESYCPVPGSARFAAKLSYLGTYSEDRQNTLREMLFSPAEEMPAERFIVAGAMYPDATNWPANVIHLEHVTPADHTAFYSSSPLTLNVTRSSMAAMGFCPSGRLFEASACGTTLLSDWWVGLDTFFDVGSEILVGRSTQDAIDALSMDESTLHTIGSRGRERTLDCHAAKLRAAQFVRFLENPFSAELGVEAVVTGNGA